MTAGQHYFADRPDSDSSPSRVEFQAFGRPFSLVTDTGVFSRGRLDPGTAVLLRHLSLPEAPATALDLGCGYGPIALAVAVACPDTTVWAVDVNERARELARRNAEAVGASNVVVCEPDGIPARIRFDAVYSNPPIRVGKAVLHELLLRWLGLLAECGSAQLVVQRNLGADSLARWLAEQGYAVRRAASQRGYRVLAVENAGA